MNISVLCIGDELLKGVTINTNQSYIGQQLLSMGIIPESSLVVPDDKIAIIKALDYLFSFSDMVITTGGLGPTADDMTKGVVAEYFGLELVCDELAVENLKYFWGKRYDNKKFPEHILEQAMVIDSCDVLQNSQGTAPGMWLKQYNSKQHGRTRYVVMLPGPPREMQPMFTKLVMPKLKNILGEHSYNKLFFIAGMAESIVEKMMKPVIDSCSELSVAYCASFDGVKLFLKSASESELGSAVEQVKKIFSDTILPDNEIDLPAEIVRLLKEKHMQLATAESCTGGKIASRITDIPGSSSVFPGGLVVYCNDWKQSELGVSSETLQQYGAVSKECVTELVNNLCTKFSTEAGIAVSGIAGPTGGSNEKPVGLVYIAVKVNDRLSVERYEFTGNRDAVRGRATSKALNTLRSMIL